ncbi:hypothetical protein LR48_Vigan01g144200 [Vigna angularis]|uniref:Uncharacterized protein n=1 Tax=Phaseolus angularis TaxID=3914 RepID=A0A0L9TN32_PHAAN|nr:hypothetical protein LR48_Vigan01g144200 [Vigna angularis]
MEQLGRKEWMKKDEKSTKEEAERRAARRNLAGENFAGQIHRLETLQVLQLRSERAGERIHLKKERVHILKPSEVRRNIAGESAIRGVETDKLGQVSNLRRDAVGVSVVVANVELAKRDEVSKLREMFPMSSLGVARCHTWEGSGRRKSCCRGGDDGGGAWRRWRGGRDRSGHVVVVEIKDLEIGKAGEVGGEGGVEGVVEEVEMAEGGQCIEGGGDWAGKLVVGEGKVGEEMGVQERERNDLGSG